MNKQARDYHDNMTKVFTSANRNSDANIKRHLDHVEKIKNENPIEEQKEEEKEPEQEED